MGYNNKYVEAAASRLRTMFKISGDNNDGDDGDKNGG